MGEVVRKNASTDDIVADVRTTSEKARAKGGVFATTADEIIGPVLTLIGTVETKHREAKAAVGAGTAEVEAADDQADALLGRVSDEIWNAVGRPAADPALSVLFPGGIAYYAQGSTEEQPVRMMLLAELLESGIHPRLPAEMATRAAAEIRASAEALDAACNRIRVPRARFWMIDRMRTAVARTAQTQLVNLKRIYKTHGFSEAEIHSVIPDRPTAPSKPAEPTPA